MIKSLDASNNNAYRILKVLTSQDFLAIDYHSNYYVLAPHLNKSKLEKIHYSHKEKINIPGTSENHIIEPIQIIDIDSIAYSVLHVGKSEFHFLKNLDQIKKKSDSLQINLFSDSILTILKHLLVFKSKELKKYLNAKNFIICGERLYLLLISRQKVGKLSLKRSERSSSKSPENTAQNSLNGYLSNELQIIKQFGLILWQCFYQKNYPSSLEVDKYPFISSIIKEMIKENITFQYLSLKISQINKVKKSLKFNICDRNQRLKTQSFHVNKKKTLKLLDFQRSLKLQTESLGSKLKTPTPMKRPKLSMHRRLLTSQTDYQAHLHQNQSEKSKLTLLHSQQHDPVILPRQSFRKKMLERNHKQKQRYKEWLVNHNFQTSFRERVKKQGQIALQKFRRSVQSNHSQQNTGRIVDQQALKAKLMLKIKNFKTSAKRDVTQLPLLSNDQNSKRQFTVQSQRVEIRKQVQKKLLFSQGSCQQIQQSAQEQFREPKQEQHIKSDEAQNKQVKSIKQKDYKIQNISNIEAYSQQKIVSDAKQLPFEQISDISLVQAKVQSKQNPPLKDLQVKNTQVPEIITKKVSLGANIVFSEKQVQKNQQQLNNQTHQIIHVPEIQPNIKTSEIELNHKSADVQYKIKTVEPKIDVKKENQSIEQIQQIKLGVVQKEKKLLKQQNEVKIQQKNNYFNQSQPSKSKIPTQQPPQKKIKYDPIEQSFHQFLTLINILGNVCVKSVKSKQKFERLQWRKCIYFIYQRFCFQRQNIVRSLTVGAFHTFRKIRKINHEDWEKWLKTPARKQLQERLAKENAKIRQDLNKFSVVLLQANKLSRKSDFYVRNRQKILDSCDQKTRLTLSRFAVDQLVQLYNFIAQENLAHKEIMNFVQDCVFALKIIAELDNFTDKSQWVRVDHYQSHVANFDQISRDLENLYSLYFNNEGLEKSSILKA